MESQGASDVREKYVPPFDEIHEISDGSNSPGVPNQSGVVADPRPGGPSVIEIPGNPILINQSVSQYLYDQLSVEVLNDIHPHLRRWAAPLGKNNYPPRYHAQRNFLQGIRKIPETIRPLHQQVAMLRTITVIEDPCLHLARTPSIIYIKPLPLYLLQWKFFDEYICPEEELYGYATGFLLTYISLVRNRSDLRIALEKGLIPEEMTWTAWSSLATTLAARISLGHINKRYEYGELQLGRINLIFLFWGGNMPYRFWSRDDRWYSQFFTAWVLVFAYFSVALGALQVVLATKADLAATVKDASYGFGIFTLVSVLVSVGILVIWWFVGVMTQIIVTWMNGFKIRRELRKSE